MSSLWLCRIKRYALQTAKGPSEEITGLNGLFHDFRGEDLRLFYKALPGADGQAPAVPEEQEVPRGALHAQAQVALEPGGALGREKHMHGRHIRAGQPVLIG